MKTPWSNLMKYGIASTAVIVLSLSIIGLLLVVGVAVLVSKFIEFTS